ncbi:hypothetical protein [Xanthomonas translucens]|uniref:Uncharacterized protein n=2 Tax=Xanthomonas campestris pv. translucens TaxID=343 RepID=A0A109HRP2_XANCT|nr:hypothetical protein [Xanthomonas translucens]KWV17129.1 hypothetical protein ATB53_00160 [Xanthomonas translucens]QSQ34715.1 hypothetical protein ISN31_03565 [Xanthomonas translucens pv. translucens]
MARQLIDTTTNHGTYIGDPALTAFSKINDNFGENYAALALLKSASRADLLGTVSQSGGAATGAVMERGSNGNGSYWRFANGMQVCVRGIGPFNLATGAVYNSGALTFPAAFSGSPQVALHINCSFPYYVTGNFEGGVTATSAAASIRNGYTAAINGIYAGYIAVGGWF